MATAIKDRLSELGILDKAREAGSTISSKVRGKNAVNLNEGERAVSALLGGALLVYGLTRKSWTGKLLAAAGTGMIHRAVSGNCKLYSALGIDHKPGK